MTLSICATRITGGVGAIGVTVIVNSERVGCLFLTQGKNARPANRCDGQQFRSSQASKRWMSP
jgi:hypothetical protein